MKIESQLTVIDGIRNTTTTKHAFEFDCLIDTENHTRKDDDLYWHHQDQLQQSELTFKSDSLLHTTHLAIRAKDANKDFTMAQSNELSLPPSDGVSIFSNKKIPTLESIMLSNQLLSVLVTQIQSQLKPTHCLPEERATIAQTNKALQTPTTRKIETNAINETFKNYQLFLNGNQVELTLNTTLFSKQEIQDLRVLIKQWLTQKNYTLKQLLINGESQ